MVQTYFKGPKKPKQDKDKHWRKIKRELLIEMRDRGQPEVCENMVRIKVDPDEDGEEIEVRCQDTFGVGFAHRQKRTRIPYVKDMETYLAELRKAAYLCVKCHRELELGPADVMMDTIDHLLTLQDEWS